TEIEVKDVSVEEFTELLYVIFPSERPVNVESYRYLLLLADRFQIEYLVELVEKYLMKTDKVKTINKMLLAEEYRLEFLKKHCMDSFKTLQEVKAFESEFSKMSKSMKNALLDRCFELIIIK
ncbi:hypothetical protein PENTCL1PPCAC_24802, partial [Pristionchus entomophagus]